MGGLDSQMSGGSGNGNCPYNAHPNPHKFSQIVNNREMTQDCAPGTMFDLSKCSCVNTPAGAAPSGAVGPRRIQASLPGLSGK